MQILTNWKSDNRSREQRGTEWRTRNPNAGGINRGTAPHEAFSFSPALSWSHARAPHLRAFACLPMCCTCALCATLVGVSLLAGVSLQCL